MNRELRCHVLVTPLKSTTTNRKLRSDSIMASDPRAKVLVAPPGADPKPYQQNNSRAEQRWPRGGRRGGRSRRGAGNAAATMDVD